MSKRWTHDEDVFLLRWHKAVTPDFVAEHDLGRPWGEGSRRLKKLTKSGAREICAKMMLERARFEFAAGRMTKWEYDRELEAWDEEERQALYDRQPWSAIDADGNVFP